MHLVYLPRMSERRNGKSVYSLEDWSRLLSHNQSGVLGGGGGGYVPRPLRFGYGWT